MQLYVADYLGDTRHLTTEQHGAYLLLLMSMWRAGGELINDPAKLARMTGCTPSRWAKISGDVLEFFDAGDGVLTHGRITVELEKAVEKSIKRADAGSLGGKAKALKTHKSNLANASDLLKHSSESEPESEEVSEAKASSPTSLPKRRPSRRAPEDWSPAEITVARLSAEGHTAGDLERALTRMRDHEYAKPHSDWDAAFRNWVRNDADRKPRHERSYHDPKFERRQANLAALERGADLAARFHGKP
jgi:uncharacterized protein YdaU (DUF1376 family)